VGSRVAVAANKTLKAELGARLAARGRDSATAFTVVAMTWDQGAVATTRAGSTLVTTLRLGGLLSGPTLHPSRRSALTSRR